MNVAAMHREVVKRTQAIPNGVGEQAHRSEAEEEGERGQKDALTASLPHVLFVKRAQVAGTHRRKDDPKSERSQDHQGPFDKRMHESVEPRRAIFLSLARRLRECRCPAGYESAQRNPYHSRPRTCREW